MFFLISKPHLLQIALCILGKHLSINQCAVNAGMSQPPPENQGRHTGEHGIDRKAMSEYVRVSAVLFYPGLLPCPLENLVNPDSADGEQPFSRLDIGVVSRNPRKFRLFIRRLV